MKNGSEHTNIYSFSCRIRIRIQNWTKTTPKPDFCRYLKNYHFIKIRYLSIFIGAAASAGGPLNKKWCDPGPRAPYFSSILCKVLGRVDRRHRPFQKVSTNHPKGALSSKDCYYYQLDLLFSLNIDVIYIGASDTVSLPPDNTVRGV